jgi:hypothetical protein
MHHRYPSFSLLICRFTLLLGVALLLSATAIRAQTSFIYQTFNDPKSSPGINGTFAMGVSGGNIVGYYYTGVNSITTGPKPHGFFYNGKTYITLDDPVAGAGFEQGTQANGIDGGNIVGYYQDVDDVFHGFLYNGATYTELDDSVAFAGPHYGTFVTGISGTGIVGYYYDEGEDSHGLLYDSATNTYLTLDVPRDANDINFETTPQGISDGNIVGTYMDEQDVDGKGYYTIYSFLYNIATNTYTTLAEPDAVMGAGINQEGTLAMGISGDNVVGYYNDVDDHTHGFLYNITTQVYTTFDDPAAGTFTNVGTGTYATGISGGNVVGYYYDEKGVHSFLATLITGIAATPAITSQPENETVLVGGSANFTVVATGNPSPTYQWQFKGKAISGATSATYAIPEVAAASVGNYTVVVSNGVGNPVTSSIVTLSLTSAPKITQQPKALTLAYGASGNLTVTATGTPILVYQWKQGGFAIIGNATDANSATLAFPFATSADAGNYTVNISNNYGGPITSGIAKVTVKITPPKITKPPVAQKVPLNTEDVNFSVTATGSDTPLLYQWTFQTGKAPAANVTFSNAHGAGSAELSLNGVTADEAGNYSVTVSNLAGSVKSKPVKLTVQ